MKNQTKLIVPIAALFVLVAMSFNTNKPAPPSRIGFVSATSLVSQIPEYTAKRGKMDTLMYEFNLEIQSKIQEFQRKEQAFIADSATMNAVIKQAKFQELQSLSQSIQAFKQTSEEEVYKMDSTLLQPILRQLQEAIDAVASEQGYTQIINTDMRSQTGTPLVLFTKEDSGLFQNVLEKFQQGKQ